MKNDLDPQAWVDGHGLSAASTNRLFKWSEVKVAQLCLTLCDPMDYTVHGIL